MTDDAEMLLCVLRAMYRRFRLNYRFTPMALNMRLTGYVFYDMAQFVLRANRLREGRKPL